MKTRIFFMIVGLVLFSSIKAQNENALTLKDLNPATFRIQQLNDSTWVSYANLNGAELCVDSIHLRGDSLQLMNMNLVKSAYTEKDLVPKSLYKQTVQSPWKGHWPKLKIDDVSLTSTKISNEGAVIINVKSEMTDAGSVLKDGPILFIALFLCLYLGLFPVWSYFDFRKWFIFIEIISALAIIALSVAVLHFSKGDVFFKWMWFHAMFILWGLFISGNLYILFYSQREKRFAKEEAEEAAQESKKSSPGVMPMILLFLFLGGLTAVNAQNLPKKEKENAIPLEYVFPKNNLDTAFWQNQIIKLHIKVYDLEDLNTHLYQRIVLQEQKLDKLTARFDSLSAVVELKENKKKK